MPPSQSDATCIACDDESITFEYHGADLEKVRLCRRCYDQYLAREMVNYWKDHIDEEKRRTGR